MSPSRVTDLSRRPRRHRPDSVVISWSGGKDSALCLAALRADRHREPVALLTCVTEGTDRVSVHAVRRELLHEQARSIGLPLEEFHVPPHPSNEAYDAAFGTAARSVCARFATRVIAFGDLYLAEVRQYREYRLHALGLEGIFPLWGRDTGDLARAFIDQGFAARLVSVDTHALPATCAGREFNDAFLNDLPAGVDPCGESGEFHTFVSGGPVFHAPVPYTVGEVGMRDDRFATCDLIPSTRSLP